MSALAVGVFGAALPVPRRPTGDPVRGAFGVVAAPVSLSLGPLVLARAGWANASLEQIADRLLRGASPDEALADAWGSFVLAVLDARDGTAWVARDPTGGRTAYVRASGGEVAIASEASALFAALPARRVSPASLVQLLSVSYVPGERTLVEGIRELLPGTVHRFTASGDETRARYFRVTEPPDVEALDARADEVAPAAARDVRAALFAAVSSALDATRGPLAAFVSGGVDSSATCAVACALGERPDVFSLSFGDDLPNELVHSALVARHLGLPHHVVVVTPDDMGRELESAAAWLDDPIGEPLTVPNLLVARAARSAGFLRGLNGEGGDPCFGGPKNIPMLLSAWYGEGGLARDQAYLSAHQKLWDDLPDLLLPDVLEAAFREEPPWAIVGPYFDDPSQTSFLNKLQRINLEQKGGHLIQPKVEKLYLASGVEPLSPLFDRRVADAAWRVPPKLKLRGNVEKLVLKDAVRDLLPATILDRKKSGMLVPVHPWLRGPLRALVHDLLGDEAVRRRGLFRPEAVAKLRAYDGATSLRGFYGAKLWLLLSLELFLRAHVDR